MQEMRVSINVENNKSNGTTCHFYNKSINWSLNARICV